MLWYKILNFVAKIYRSISISKDCLKSLKKSHTTIFGFLIFHLSLLKSYSKRFFRKVAYQIRRNIFRDNDIFEFLLSIDTGFINKLYHSKYVIRLSEGYHVKRHEYFE